MFGLNLINSMSELYTICFLVSLLCKECYDKFSELLLTGSTSWETGSASLSGFVRVV